MTVFHPHDSATEAIKPRDLFKIRETRCWPCLGSGRIGRYGRRVCPNCDGTGRDRTLVLAATPPESSPSH
jgi:hypothetical protein